MENNLKIKLSWKKYWEQFKEHHGEPVEYNGRCLFEDGWRYALSDPSGPEYPPPTDEKECLLLRIKYQEIRLGLVTSEYTTLLNTISNLELLQQRFSLPLKQIIDGENKQNYTDLKLEEIRKGRLEWLREDIEICKENISILNQALDLLRERNGNLQHL